MAHLEQFSRIYCHMQGQDVIVLVVHREMVKLRTLKYASIPSSSGTFI